MPPVTSPSRDRQRAVLSENSSLRGVTYSQEERLSDGRGSATGIFDD